MMAHEIPLPIHQTQYKNPPDSTKKARAAKGDKNLKSAESERKLPNGESVDFGKGSSKSKSSSAKKAGKKSKDDTNPSSASSVSSSTSSTKKKNASNSSRVDSPTLPNGEKPNFYNNESTKSNEPTKGSKKKGSKEPSLPDGAKPNFDAGRPSRKKVANDQALPNGEKPVFNGDKPASSKKTKASQPKDKKAVAIETYAGSSFHSSPAALNLPKPSFKTSPKQVVPTAVDETVESNGSTSQTISTSSSPSSQVMHPPPVHPVTAYPPGSVLPVHGPGPLLYQQQHPVPPNQFIQPGFAYNYTPQGYIQYQYPTGVPPQFAHMQPPQGYPQSAPIITHYQQPVPAQLPIQGHTNPYNNQNSNTGQKISFNDLLGSTKG